MSLCATCCTKTCRQGLTNHFYNRLLSPALQSSSCWKWRAVSILYSSTKSVSQHKQVAMRLQRRSCAACLSHVHQDQKCTYDETARNKTWASSDSLLREHTNPVVKISPPATKTQTLRESRQVTGWDVCEISLPSMTTCSGAASASSVAAYSTLVDAACSPITAWAMALITTPRSPDCCGVEGRGWPSFSVRRTGVSCRCEYRVVPCAVPADRVSSSMPSWSRNTSLKATCPDERAP